MEGLDNDHSLLLEKIICKEVWEHSEFESVCKEIGLMPDGAIESINEIFYNKYDENLIENDDNIQINKEILKELVNE